MMLGLIGGTIDQAKRLVDLHRSAGARAGHAPEILSLRINRRYLWPKTTAERGWRLDRAGMDQRAAPRRALMVLRAQELPPRVRPKFETEEHPAL